MQIELTKKEYELLLDMLYIADWVMNANVIGELEEAKPYQNLEQKIFSLAKDNGLEEYIVWDEKLRKYFPTIKFDEERPAMEFIEIFENESFWEELIERLAARDLVKKYGEDKVKKMRPEERFRELDKIEEKYSSEFETNGLDNIQIG
jgi:hypothetical protein